MSSNSKYAHIPRCVRPRAEDYDDVCGNQVFDEEHSDIFRQSRVNSPMGEIVRNRIDVHKDLP